VESTCVMPSGQQDGGLAARVPVPHPVQSEVPPEPGFLLLLLHRRPPLTQQLLQNRIASTRLPGDHLDLDWPVNRETEENTFPCISKSPLPVRKEPFPASPLPVSKEPFPASLSLHFLFVMSFFLRLHFLFIMSFFLRLQVSTSCQ